MFRTVWTCKSEGTCELRYLESRLNLTSELPLITFDIKAYLSRNGRRSGDDDDADVQSRVRLLGVVNVEGDVGWGHGHAEADSFGELVLAKPNLTRVKIDHLDRETHLDWHHCTSIWWDEFFCLFIYFNFFLYLKLALKDLEINRITEISVLHKDNPDIQMAAAEF